MTVKEFIQVNGLMATEEDFFLWVENFKAEIAAGLAGEKSSLRMIPTYLSVEALRRTGGSVIVLDAGGTNLRVALMELVLGQSPRKVWFEKVPMLGTRGGITIDEFYDCLAERIAPVADKASRIGFCFSFPCEILPDLDGRILHFDKEVDIAGAAGSILGKGLHAALKRRNLPQPKVVVINDTVAAMLGGMIQSAGGKGDHMGFILGTGTNICASFPNAAITKLPELTAKSGTTIINLESGGFDKLTRSRIDQAFDDATANPGDQVLEKLISGAYQGPLALAYLKAAAKADIFTARGKKGLAALDTLTAADISFFLERGGGVLGNAVAGGSDREAAEAILDAFFRRAARLTAATVAATLDATGQAGDPERPVNIAAEGTTFYQCRLLHKHLLEDMKLLTEGRLGLHSRFIQGENPNLTGTALAALAR